MFAAAEMSLCAPEQGLHVVAILLQHHVASAQSICRVVQLQIACSLVQQCKLLQLCAPCSQLRAVLLGIGLVDDLHALVVLLQSELKALALEQLPTHLLSQHAKTHFLFVGHCPHLLVFVKVKHLQVEDDLVSHDLREAQPGLQTFYRDCACHQRSLALLHLADSALQGVAHVAVAAEKCKLLRSRKARQRIGAIGHQIHAHNSSD
mmetsp:Transcript_15368/g.27401  ORF Transcript_15368/g.27401 Transcript_15368/m.27401 type:complete len:206 (-) Transcript_15368:67-684(-)